MKQVQNGGRYGVYEIANRRTLCSQGTFHFTCFFIIFFVQKGKTQLIHNTRFSYGKQDCMVMKKQRSCSDKLMMRSLQNSTNFWVLRRSLLLTAMQSHKKRAWRLYLPLLRILLLLESKIICDSLLLLL